MTFSQDDLPYIKGSLSTFLVICLLGGGAVLFSQKYANNTLNEKRMAQQQIQEARNKLNAAQDDLQNMGIYQKEFSDIQRRGIIGEEQRLNLIEELDKLRSHNHVLDFKYAIAPQQPYKPAVTVDSGNFDLKISPMTLQLELLHEGQFMRFFDSLRRDTNGWFILNKCTLERTNGTAAQLKADCAGGWLSMKNRNAP